jgi:putative tricarboxylic transport membrane protein
MMVAGIGAYILKKLRYDLAPLIIGFILAEPIELRLSQSILYARGNVIDFFFIQRPIASFFLLAGILWVVGMVAMRYRRRARQAVVN